LSREQNVRKARKAWPESEALRIRGRCVPRKEESAGSFAAGRTDGV